MTPLDLAAWLKQHPDTTARLTLDHDAVIGLRDELHRLLQSNDRMRKQNRKLRKRMERLKGGAVDLPEDADDEPGADLTE